MATYAYNPYGDPTAKTETYGTGASQVVRTSTTGYNTAERTVSSSIAVTQTSAGGTPVPTVSYGYDTSTGLPTTASTGTGPSIVNLATSYNNIGEPTSYTDATGNVSHTGYDLNGRTISLNDGKGTTTSSYDSSSEHRGLATGEDIGVTGSPSTFAATYDTAGKMATETYPNGLVATRHYDNAGNLTMLTYTKSGSTWMTFTQNVNALGQIANQSSPQSSQTLGYDPDDRLTTVADTYSGACATRVYAFDTDSNRTSVKSYPGTGSGGATCTTSTTPTTSSYSYDAGDRLTSDTAGSYSYDSLGRTSSIPAGDAQGIGAHASITGTATIGYYANDMVATQQQATTNDSFTLDPDQNRVNTQTEGTTTTSDHYSDDSDSPNWTATSSSTWSRNVTGISGGLAATSDQTGAVTLQLVNPHGDTIATCADASSAANVTSYSETTEYGTSRSSTTAYTTYGWLGGEQRSGNDLGGLILMGARLYSRLNGRFGSEDPIYGGNSNSYNYPDDPINESDTSELSTHLRSFKNGFELYGATFSCTKKKKATRWVCDAAYFYPDTQHSIANRFSKHFTKGWTVYSGRGGTTSDYAGNSHFGGGIYTLRDSGGSGWSVDIDATQYDENGRLTRSVLVLHFHAGCIEVTAMCGVGDGGGPPMA